jgi:hypothetical protein
VLLLIELQRGGWAASLPVVDRTAEP